MLPDPPSFAGEGTRASAIPLLTLGTIDEATPNLFRSVATVPRPARSLGALIDEAIDALLRKDLEAALHAYRQAQVLAPENRTIVGNVERLTKLLRRTGDVTRAIEMPRSSRRSV